jgi:hypothetical protein
VTVFAFIVAVWPSGSFAETPGELISQGKTQLFSGTVEGALSAHQIFSSANDQYGQRCDPKPFFGNCSSQQAREKAQIHGYLAVTRLLDLMARNDGQAPVTVPDFMAGYGVTMTGDDLDTLKFETPLVDDQYIDLPPSSPDSQAVQGFLAGPVLDAIDASIKDMDEVLYYVGVADTYSIDTSETLESSFPGVETDVVVDAGDYYMFRAGLKAARAFMLMASAWNLDVDLRDAAARINRSDFNFNALKENNEPEPPDDLEDRNLFDLDFQEIIDEILKNAIWDEDIDFLDSLWKLDILPFFDFKHLNPGIILARYPDLLTLNSNGPADLAKAKTAILEAVSDYKKASDGIRARNANEPPEGKETFFQMGPCEVEKEALFRDVIERFNTALSSGNPLEMTFEEDVWTVVRDDDKEIEMSLIYLQGEGTQPRRLTEGVFHGRHGCDFIGCAGWVNCVTTRESDGKEIITLNLVASDASEESRWVLTGTLNREENTITDGTYEMITDADPVQGGFTASLDSSEAEDPVQTNPNPFFGSPGPYHLRDFLPQFSRCGEPVHGTMGYGLNPDDPDATLGGIFPEMTQDRWELDPQPAGIIEIPDWPGAWTGIDPVFTDRTSDNDPDMTGSDIHHLYLATDDDHLYVRMTLADGSPGTEIDPGWESSMHYMVQFRQMHPYADGVPFTGAVHREDGWKAFVHTMDNNGQNIQEVYLSADVAVGDGYIEWHVPLSYLGTLTGKFLTTWTHWTPGPVQPSDYNQTCLQVGPLAEVSGTVTIPDFNQQGPVFVDVFHSDGELDTSPANLLGSVMIYPDEISDEGVVSFTLSHLPAGTRAFVVTRWDADYNGIPSQEEFVQIDGPMILGKADEIPGGMTPVLLILKMLAGMPIDGELDDHMLPHKQNLGVDDAVLMLQKEAGIRK